jgi:type I restriction enzyme S subunit
MKLETFFEKFDQFADAPDAVVKMRELVRNFAVKGKLVSQDPNDEPAEALVARIAAALPNKKSENPFFGAIEDSITDESEFELPPGWAWLPLGHVGIWATGCGFPMQYQGETNGEFLFCKVSDMNLPGNEIEIHTTVHSIEADVMKKIRARANPVGTVIFPKIGGAIATHKRRLVIKPTIIDNNCSGIQPIGLTDNRWLLLFMRSLDLTKYQSGTSVPAVSQGSIDPIRIGLPPLAEQKRIVEKVDELMALCDRLALQQQERGTRHAALARASLARFADAPTPANLTFLFHPSYAISPADLRKSILTLAVQGKLVRFEAENDAQTVGDHIEFQNGYAFKSQWFKPDGMRLCRNVNVSHGVVDWRESAFVDDDIAKEFERFALSEGDIVLSLDRPLITTGLKVARIRKSDLPCLLLQRVAKPVPKHDQLDMYYFLLWLNSSEFVDSIDPGRSNGVPHISTRQVQLLPFVLPPLAEQRRIVAKVEQLMALVDALETQLAASRATAENLLAAVVAELTEGTHASPAC